jgi:nucleoid-associated protein EbfC
VAGEPPTFHDLVKQAQVMQERLALAQADLTEMELTRSAGGGLVTVTMKGTGEVVGVAFDQAAVDEGDAEALAALTLDAMGQAADAVKALVAEKMEAARAGLGVGLGRGSGGY